MESVNQLVETLPPQIKTMFEKAEHIMVYLKRKNYAVVIDRKYKRFETILLASSDILVKTAFTLHKILYEYGKCKYINTYTVCRDVEKESKKTYYTIENTEALILLIV